MPDPIARPVAFALTARHDASFRDMLCDFTKVPAAQLGTVWHYRMHHQTFLQFVTWFAAENGHIPAFTPPAPGTCKVTGITLLGKTIYLDDMVPIGVYWAVEGTGEPIKGEPLATWSGRA